MSASNPLARILDTHRLTEPNYKDWLRNYKIILDSKKLSYILDQDPPTLLVRPTVDQRASLKKWTDDDNKARYYMLDLMSNELKCQHEDIKIAHQILAHLQELFGEHSRTARYEISKQLFHTKMKKGEDVGAHMNSMIRSMEELESLDFTMDFHIQVDMILQSLPE